MSNRDVLAELLEAIGAFDPAPVSRVVPSQAQQQITQQMMQRLQQLRLQHQAIVQFPNWWIPAGPGMSASIFGTEDDDPLEDPPEDPMDLANMSRAVNEAAGKINDLIANPELGLAAPEYPIPGTSPGTIPANGVYTIRAIQAVLHFASLPDPVTADPAHKRKAKKNRSPYESPSAKRARERSRHRSASRPSPRGRR